MPKNFFTTLTNDVQASNCESFIEFVEKRKISYFGLARNLIRHLISPNQDDLSYSAQTFISG